MPRCFVIQPFDKGQYDKRYRDILMPAIREAELEPYRVDEDPSTTVLIEDIEKGIQESEICLADITTNNPNIWYEVGFAIANGRPVVLICADPRPEPFPFDIRHRAIITYAMHSSSDFEKLKNDVTERLKAQVKKAEALETVAAMAQVKPTEGLAPHEVAVLLTIMTEVSNPDSGVSPWEIQQAMKRSGYTAMASNLALASLKKKGMIEDEIVTGSNENTYLVLKVSSNGLEWLLENQGNFDLKIPEKREDYPPITDEDIPF
jgi:nucleoside 2-deoxyribosyltransferase